MKHIHFVCRGNVYRSRMAEAYAKSLVRPDLKIEITSSGIEAHRALNGEVDPVAVRHLQDDEIAEHLSQTWQQTTQQMLDSSDLVVFMSESLLDDARKLFRIDEAKIRVFDVPDEDGVYGQVKEVVNKVLGEVA